MTAAFDHLHPEHDTETFEVPQSVAYNWKYENTRRRLVRLYENAKRDQWNSTDRLDWSVDVDPEKGLLPDAGIGIFGTPMWDRLSESEIRKLRHEAVTWQLCQFLHGEQGALLATAQIVDSVPWFEGKQYGATQVMDEARHVEVYRKYITGKLQHEYPVNPELKSLLDVILTDSRWDMKFLGMQIIVEGLALAAFGTIRDTATCPLRISAKSSGRSARSSSTRPAFSCAIASPTRKSGSAWVSTFRRVSRPRIRAPWPSSSATGSSPRSFPT
jgi:hypothetical protein